MTICHDTIHSVGPAITILLHPSYREPHTLLSNLLKQPLFQVDSVNYYFRSSRHFFLSSRLLLFLTTPIHLVKICHFDSDRLFFYLFIFFTVNFMCEFREKYLIIALLLLSGRFGDQPKLIYSGMLSEKYFL